MPDSIAAPDDPAAISALAREHGLAAVQVLVHALSSPDTQAAIMAAVALLDLGYGKPVQPLTLDSLHGITVEVHASEPQGIRPNGEDRLAWSVPLRES